MFTLVKKKGRGGKLLSDHELESTNHTLANGLSPWYFLFASPQMCSQDGTCVIHAYMMASRLKLIAIVSFFKLTDMVLRVLWHIAVLSLTCLNHRSDGLARQELFDNAANSAVRRLRKMDCVLVEGAIDPALHITSYVVVTSCGPRWRASILSH